LTKEFVLNSDFVWAAKKILILEPGKFKPTKTPLKVKNQSKTPLKVTNERIQMIREEDESSEYSSDSKMSV